LEGGNKPERMFEESGPYIQLGLLLLAGLLGCALLISACGDGSSRRNDELIRTEIFWDRAVPTSDGRHIKVYYERSGSQGDPRIEVRRRQGTVSLTLSLKRPVGPNQLSAVGECARVILAQPLGAERIVDGTAGTPPPPEPRSRFDRKAEKRLRCPPVGPPPS